MSRRTQNRKEVKNPYHWSGPIMGRKPFQEVISTDLPEPERKTTGSQDLAGAGKHGTPTTGHESNSSSIQKASMYQASL